MIRGIVEQEIQAMVSKRDNIATHHLYQAWDPVPCLSPATTGTCGRGSLHLGQTESSRVVTAPVGQTDQIMLLFGGSLLNMLP